MRFANRHRSGGEGSGGPSRRTGELKTRVVAHKRMQRLAEGVGFGPTVGCPTLDFESSALNRTQPPFLQSRRNAERVTSNIQRPMQLSRDWAFSVGRWTLSVYLQANRLRRMHRPLSGGEY